MATHKKESIVKPIALALVCLASSVIFAFLYAQSPDVEAYVIGWNEGEILLDSRGRTNSINVSPVTGSTDLGFVTQDMPPGSGIAVHRHVRTEEILFIHTGKGTLMLGDDRLEVEAGDTIFIPPGTYHGLVNPDSSVQIIGVVTPPGLEQAFREMFWHSDEEPKQLSEAELNAIGDRYDSALRQE